MTIAKTDNSLTANPIQWVQNAPTTGAKLQRAGTLGLAASPAGFLSPLPGDGTLLLIAGLGLVATGVVVSACDRSAVDNDDTTAADDDTIDDDDDDNTTVDDDSTGDDDTTPPPPTDNYAIYFVDVGQGDAILLEANDGQYVLVDSGPSDSDNDLIDFMLGLGVESLTRVILSHPHYDHYGEFEDVMDYFEIEEFYYSGYDRDNSTYVALMEKLEATLTPVFDVGDGYEFVVDNLTFTFYHPPVEGFIDSDSDINDNSLVLIVSNDSGTNLFLGGDIETDGIASLLSRHSGGLDVELQKANHHGSADGTNQALLDETTPTYAFICVGENNAYGHPHQQALDLFEEAGAYICRTDENGTISIFVEEMFYEVVPEYGTETCPLEE